MSSLQDFLNRHPVDHIIDEVVVSPRFQDENGKIMKFKIQAMTIVPSRICERDLRRWAKVERLNSMRKDSTTQ